MRANTITALQKLEVLQRWLDWWQWFTNLLRAAQWEVSAGFDCPHVYAFDSYE